jgi:hypothetical protein
MVTGAKTNQVVIDSSDANNVNPADMFMAIKCGDTDIFSIIRESILGGPGGVGGQNDLVFWMRVTPRKSGTFACTVQETFRNETNTTSYDFQVTIH